MALLEFRRLPEDVDIGHDVFNGHQLDTLRVRLQGAEGDTFCHGPVSTPTTESESAILAHIVVSRHQRVLHLMASLSERRQP